ncbi:MAG: DNA polymerase III [Spirochaetales bacterium]|nr:DNA polymerase III [Spirochaetales bacterium]
MFENLLAQDEAASLLLSDFSTGSLPPTLLFAGPANSGKLSAALELARGLSCEAAAPGAWNCACSACERHRALLHPDLLVLGPKAFSAEIAAAGELLARAPEQKAARFLFVRAVRKLRARFSPVLYDGEESRLVKAAQLVQDLDALVDEAEPRARLDASGAAALSAKVLPLARKLESLVPDAVPVWQVRALERWMRIAPSGLAKTVVIENADRMLDGARNALLKALEEPPPRVRFVLCAERRGAMIATILSRSRTYRFRPRDPEASRLVLERVFRAPPPLPDSLDAFLASRAPGGSDPLLDRTRDLVASLLAERASLDPLDPPLAELAARSTSSPDEALDALREASGDFGKDEDAASAGLAGFLKAFTTIMRELVRDARTGPGAVALASRWNALVAEARRDHAVFKLAPPALVERLVSAARKTA